MGNDRESQAHLDIAKRRLADWCYRRDATQDDEQQEECSGHIEKLREEIKELKDDLETGG